MYIVDVFPICKSAINDNLSYFSSKKISVGSLVTIPLRKQRVLALVVDSQAADKQKISLKKTNFALRKVLKIERNFLDSAFIKAAQETSEYHAASLGQSLYHLVSQKILNNPQLLQDLGGIKKARQTSVQIIQAPQNLRYEKFHHIIEKCFVKQESVFMIAPTISDIKNLAKEFGDENKKNAFVLTATITEKQLAKQIQQIKDCSSPVLIIATAPFLSIWRWDISTIILEKEASRAYQTIARPFLDLRFFVEKIAEQYGCQLFLGDNLLRLETLYKHRFQFDFEKNISKTKVSILDLKTDPKGEHKKFTILDKQVKQTICKSLIEKNKCFVFCGKRGLASQTICADCGEIILCDKCSTPIALHKGRMRNVFICHHCGNRQDTNIKCPHCDSYRLRAYGVGVEAVAEELRAEFPQNKILRLDKDTVKSLTEVKKVIEEFIENQGSILLGTEMALTYLPKVDYSIISTLDNLFALPDFHANERYLGIVLNLLDKTKKRLIIQTRQAHEKVFDFIDCGDLKKYYKEEIKLREKFKYPPFYTLIKITYQNTQENVRKEMEILKTFLQDFDPQVFSAFTETQKKLSVSHLLIRIPNQDWPQMTLIKKLQTLPPCFSIDVNPNSLL